MIVYEIGENIYINMTNRCSNDCDFCVRLYENSGKTIFDNKTQEDFLPGNSSLWLEKEPSVHEIIAELEKYDLSKYPMIVFCGFGEPFIRFFECVEVAKWIKRKYPSSVIRVNTNGHANLIHKEDVSIFMKGLFDIASVSLNASNAEDYQRICRSQFGIEAYDAVLNFAKLCSEKGIKVFMSVVRDENLTEDEIKKCEVIAQSCGATLKIREKI